ncbi:MAG: hypothetical protein LBR47_02820 [Spirochaetaceae bacterium]|jgi:molecular chaperone GrpE (heat shock protein)|nr:hypothetical protein [Spirochaetaceae bacterium]
MASKYNFLDKNPTDIMTEDEIDNFEEAMSPFNSSRKAEENNLSDSVERVTKDLENILF